MSSMPAKMRPCMLRFLSALDSQRNRLAQNLTYAVVNSRGLFFVFQL